MMFTSVDRCSVLKYFDAILERAEAESIYLPEFCIFSKHFVTTGSLINLLCNEIHVLYVYLHNTLHRRVFCGTLYVIVEEERTFLLNCKRNQLISFTRSKKLHGVSAARHSLRPQTTT